MLTLITVLLVSLALSFVVSCIKQDRSVKALEWQVYNTKRNKVTKEAHEAGMLAGEYYGEAYKKAYDEVLNKYDWLNIKCPAMI